MTPKVTVLMAVYNGEEFLREAVDSILEQTFSDFEFLIVDDGSTDDSTVIIESYRDHRIRLVSNKKNIGLTKSLNKGLHLSQGTYIARMDADEISMPNRIAKQVSFLDDNQEIGCCGTLTRIFGEHDGEWRYPLDHDRIKVDLLFHSCLVHASVMLRKEVLKKHNIIYDENCRYAQDYELWVRLSKVTRLANIDAYLLLHRLHDSSIGSSHSEKQIATANRIRLSQLDCLGVQYTTEEARLLHKLGRNSYRAVATSLSSVHKLLLKIRNANQKRQEYSTAILSEILGMHLKNVVCLNKGSFITKIQVLFLSQLSLSLGLGMRQRFSILVKDFLTY
ncbi:MAG: glycosyltransferase [Candidatus Electrothrix sp. ATG2]|nr:glycosyltransferase [Candidatus Electrothrix sp. ATG2]